MKIANKGNKTIQATLRPPFRSDQKSNSVAVQCIQKAVGYQKILNLITVLNFTYSVVNRGKYILFFQNFYSWLFNLVNVSFQNLKKMQIKLSAVLHVKY